MYRGYLFALPLADWPRRLLAWAGLLARQFTPVGAMLAGLGIARLWQSKRPLALTSALAFGAASVYAIGYNTADSLVYLAPMLPLTALWLGMGFFQVSQWLGRRLHPWIWAILLLPLIQALLFWSQIDLSDERTAIEWAEQVLQRAPSRAILLTEQDGHTFTLWYVQDVLGERPDVTTVDVDLWGQESYQQQMADILKITADETSFSQEELMRQTGRPVVRVVDLATEAGAP
jgi:hypothetical protein